MEESANKYNYSIDKSLNKVYYWLNNSQISKENTSAKYVSNKSYHFQDRYINVKNLNESVYSAETVNLNGKSLEDWQSKNEQVNNIFRQKYHNFFFKDYAYRVSTFNYKNR